MPSSRSLSCSQIHCYTSKRECFIATSKTRISLIAMRRASRCSPTRSNACRPSRLSQKELIRCTERRPISISMRSMVSLMKISFRVSRSSIKHFTITGPCETDWQASSQEAFIAVIDHLHLFTWLAWREEIGII